MQQITTQQIITQQIVPKNRQQNKTIIQICLKLGNKAKQ